MSITLSGDGVGVAALSSHALRAGNDPASRSRLRVFAVPSITSAFSLYAQRAKVLIGVDLLPEPINRPTPSGGFALDLTDVPAADAIDRITRLDSRLTWTVADGIFSVRPRPDLVPTSPLDTMVESFVAQDETVDAILGRIAMLFGGGSRAVEAAGAGGPSPLRSSKPGRASRARCLSGWNARPFGRFSTRSAARREASLGG